MTYTDMETALAEAERAMNIVDSVSAKIARLLIGRLRKVNSKYTLVALKRELQDYDARSGQWGTRRNT